MKYLARLFPLLVLALPLSVSAATSVVIGADSRGNGFFGISFGSGSFCMGGSICGLANTFLYLINNVAVPVIFALAFIVLLYGIAKSYIFSGGEPEAVSQGHRIILWGVIAFAVMISLWGLVNIVSNTFGIAGFPVPPFPRSI